MVLNLTAPLLSLWPSVLPLELPHLSSPWNQSWAVCLPWSGGKLMSTSRAGQPWALHPSVHELPFLSDCTLHSSIHGMNDGVSMNKIWDQSWRDMEVILPLLLDEEHLHMWTHSGPAVSVWVLCIPLDPSIWPPVYDWAKILTPSGTGGYLELCCP